MKDHWVEVKFDFKASQQTVFEHLAEHENLAPVFGAKITRIKDGATERNGIGSVRMVKVGPTPAAEETIIAFEPYSLIEYKITNDSLIKNHIGIMKFSELPGGGTHIDYRIRLASNIPGLAAVMKKVLTAGIVKGFTGLNQKLA